MICNDNHINKLLKEYFEQQILARAYTNIQKYGEAARVRNKARDIETILHNKIKKLNTINKIVSERHIISYRETSNPCNEISLYTKWEFIDSYCEVVFKTTDPQSIVTQIDRELKFKELGI